MSKGREDIAVGRGWEGTGCYPYEANQTSKANKLYLPRRFHRAVRCVFYYNEQWGYFSFWSESQQVHCLKQSETSVVFTVVKSKPKRIYSDQSKQLGKQSNEPIKTQENLKTSRGRLARENGCWQATMGFSFWLVEKMPRNFATNHKAKRGQTKAVTQLLFTEFSHLTKNRYIGRD